MNTDLRLTSLAVDLLDLELEKAMALSDAMACGGNHCPQSVVLWSLMSDVIANARRQLRALTAATGLDGAGSQAKTQEGGAA